MRKFSVVDDSDLEMASQKDSEYGGPSTRKGTAACNKPEFDSDEDVSYSHNFSIRDYVSMVRSNDIRNNWPFSQRYLQICLDYGTKPVLPPFEHPQSVRDLIQEKFKLEAAIHGSDSERNDVICADIAANDSKHSGNSFIIRVPAKRRQTGQKSSRKIARQKSVQSVSVRLRDQDGIAACRENGNLKSNGCEGIKTKIEEVEEFRGERGEQPGEDNQTPKEIAGTSEDNEWLKPIAERSEDNEGSKPIAETSEDNEGSKPIEGTSEDNKGSKPISGTSEDNEGSKPISGRGERELGTTPCKGEDKERDYEIKTSEFMEQSNGVKLPNSEIRFKPNSEISSKARRKRTDRPEILSDIKNRFLKRIKQSNRMLTFEIKSQEHIDSSHKERMQGHLIEQSKADSGRTENLVNSGSSILDGMMVKVCPVCRNFSSTSNTALNAHMDHCLDAKPNAEITETKFTKHKTKVRKKRSMADICAVAPSRTLEDLVYTVTREQHHSLHVDVLKWNGSNIKRGPRTPLSRVAKRDFDYVHPNAKKLRISSSLKMECLPNLQKESHNELSLSEDKEKESGGTRKSKRSAFSNMTRAGKSLNSLGFNKFIEKVPRTSAAKHNLNEGISQTKFQRTSEEIAREEKLPSSVYSTSWACFNKQGSSRRKKLKHKLVSLNLAGFGQRRCNSGDGVPMNVLEPKSQNPPESSRLSEGKLVGSKESTGGFVSHSSDKGHNLPVVVSSKRKKAKHSRKGVDNYSNSSEEVEEFFTSKRMKNLSSLNFQNTMMHTVTRVHSSVCEIKSPTSGKAQIEQEVSFRYCPSNEEKLHSSHDLAKISVNDTFNSKNSGSIVLSKTLQNETGTSVHGTQLPMSCQLKRAQSKEHFKESKKMLNLKTLKRPNSFQRAAGSSLKTSGLECSNVEQKRPRYFKSNLGSPKMKKVSHIVHDLMNMKDTAKIDSQHRVHGTEFNRESRELIYDAGSTSNQAYGTKIKDCTSTKAKSLCAMETSSMDKQHRTSPDLQSGAMSAGEHSAKPLETSVNVGHEIPGQNQARLRSTVSTIYEASKKSSQNGEVATDEDLENCMLTYAISEKTGFASGLLEACCNQPSYQQDASTQAMGKNVAGNLSPNKGKDSSESCVSFQSQLNSCSVEELADLDEYVGKKADILRNSDRQMEIQAPSHKLLTQNDSFCQKSVDVATAILKPSNVSFRNHGSDSTSYIETKPAYISSVANKSFQRLSTQELVPVSNEILVLRSDSIEVAPVLNGTNFADKPQISSELTIDKLGIARTSLTSIDEVSPAMPQSFENLVRPAFDLSIQTSSSIITSTGLPPISEANLFHGSSILLDDSKSFATTSDVLPSVSMTQLVSDSILSAKSGEISTSSDVLHGSVLIPSSPKHLSILNGVWKSSNNTSAWILENQNGLKQNLTNSLSSSLFEFVDGTNGSCAGNSACGFPPQVSDFPSHISTLPTHKIGVHSGSKSNPKICGNQSSDSNTVSSLGSDMFTEQTDFPEKISSFGTANYSRDPSIVHIFGNPILRLMGKNVMLSSKDGTQSKQVEDSCIESSDAPTNRNDLKLLESRPEVKLGQDGHGQTSQALERYQASDRDMLQCFEGGTGKDSNMFQAFEAESKDLVSFSRANDYRKQKPAGLEKIPQVYDWNLAAPAWQSLAVIDRVKQPWMNTKMSSSCVLPEPTSNGVSHGPADECNHVKWKSSDSSVPHYDNELIIIDDNIDTETSSIEASFAPTFLLGRSCQLQEGLLMSTHLNLNSKVRSGLTSLDASNNLNHFSSENLRTLNYGSNVLNAKEIPSELKSVGINFHRYQ